MLLHMETGFSEVGILLGGLIIEVERLADEPFCSVEYETSKTH
jgi:hypothetical protein